MTREEAIEFGKMWLEVKDDSKDSYTYRFFNFVVKALEQQPTIGHCKDCKYFEYDTVAKGDRIPLIVAHEICKRWGDGCKTREDGYCFLFEPQESEG